METKDANILTLHPEGKEGVIISKRKYDAIKDYILDTLDWQNEVFLEDLVTKAKTDLSGDFDDDIAWCVVAVENDLEARCVIERTAANGSHAMRLRQHVET